MDITIDARAALWYKGTGMGTYARDLLGGLQELNRHTYNIVLPQGVLPLAEAIPVLKENSQENIGFWELVHRNPAKPVEGSQILHNLHNGFGLPPDPDCATVVTIHDLIPLIMPEYCGSPYKEIFNAEIGQIAAQADKIIAASHCTKKDIIQHLKIKPQKITVIYQGADRIFRPLNKGLVQRELRKHYGLEGNYILYVGGFNPRKNLSTLVAAFSLIQHEIDWNLVIVGKEGKQAAEIKALAAESIQPGRVIFTGYIPTAALPLFYNGAKVFVYPSLYGGFGLPPLEAASCGAAVILANSASLPEVMANKALYVNARDEKELARSILHLYRHENERITMARDCFAHSRQFSRQNAAKQTLAVYENLCR